MALFGIHLSHKAVMHSSSNLTHTASDLLSYEPFIRSIARSLISNEDQIGDIVQETWLRALKKPPREAGSIKSWLGRVTRNLALDQKRREGTRKSREVAAARDESVLDDEKDLALHSKIVEGVLALEEPYKSVVILHYYRGMKLAEVARKLDRKSATVRSQLKRAHEMLRGKLDSDYGGDRATWMALCVPLASKKAGVSASGVALKAAVVLMVAAAIVAGSRAWMEDSNANGEHETAVLARPEDSERVDANAEFAAADRSAAIGDRTALGTADHVFVSLDGEPVEGAEVWCLDLSLVTREVFEADPDFMTDGELLFAALGTQSTSNAEGHAGLVRPSGDFAVLVTHGSYLKALDAELTKVSPIEVELEKVAIVSARAIDRSNQVIGGVPVVLMAEIENPDRDDMSGPERYDLMTRNTDAEAGIAFFRGFDNSFPDELKPQWSLRLLIPGMSTTKRPFALERGSDDPIDLRFGDTGTLVVRGLDENGAPILLPGTVTVHGLGDSGHYLTEPLVDGSAGFPFVGVGSQLSVTLAIPELGATWKREIDGPANLGATVTCDIQRPSGPTMTGRILGDSGSPLANAKVRLSIFDEEFRHLHRTEIKTDANGGFTAEVKPELVNTHVYLTFVHYGWGNGTFVAEQKEQTLLSSMTTELGEVRLLEYRHGIEGRCVNADGEPLAGIELSAQQIPGFGGSGATTDEEGKFRLPGIFSEDAAVETERAKEWLLRDPFPVPADANSVEIVLIRAGSIEGAVQLEEQLDPGRVIVVAYDESKGDAAGVRWSAFTYCEAESGKYTLPGLGSGTYRVQFSLDGVLLRKIEGVEVTESQSSNDPRVKLVDLLESTESVHFRVVDSTGKPARVGSAVGYALAGGERVGMAINERDGDMNLMFKSSPDATIYVSRSGCRGVFLTVEEATGDIVLEPGIPVELNTLQRLKLKRGEDTYTFSLRRIEEDPRCKDLNRSVGIPSALMKNGTATVHFPAPGRYELCYSKQSSAGSGGLMFASADTSVPSTVEGEFVIDVPESSSTVPIDITLPEKLPE